MHVEQPEPEPLCEPGETVRVLVARPWQRTVTDFRRGAFAPPRLDEKFIPACAHATVAADVLVGVWHSVATEARLRWVVDSWYDPGSVVFLAQANGSFAHGRARVPLLGTGAPADDYLGTLQKGLLGLLAMRRAAPRKKWFAVVGDDVYVSLARLARLLSAFDPEAEHCLSEGQMSRTNWYKGFRLNGGAGIVTSAALTRALAARGRARAVELTVLAGYDPFVVLFDLAVLGDDAADDAPAAAADGAMSGQRLIVA